MWDDRVKVLQITNDNFQQLNAESLDFSMFLVERGGISIGAVNGRYDLRKGEMYFSHSGLRQEIISVSEDSEVYGVIWNRQFALTAYQGRKMINQLFFAKRYLFPVLLLVGCECEMVRNYMLNFGHSLSEKSHLYYNQIVSTTFTGLMSLVVHLYNLSDAKQKILGTNAMVKYAERVVRLFEQGNHPNMSLTYYAEKLGVSNAYLHRVFKDVFRQSFTQILDYYRFYAIHQQLLYTNKTVEEIADEMELVNSK